VQIEKGFDHHAGTAATLCVFNGKAVKFMSTGATNQPSGDVLSYTEKFVPSKGSYLELN
jgi:hypothetical protein